MGIKVDWKKIGQIGLAVGKQMFPVIGIIEQMSKFKNLTSQEKQDLAFKAIHDDLVASLLPGVAQDPRIEAQIRKMVDDAVAFNNIVAQVMAEKGK